MTTQVRKVCDNLLKQMNIRKGAHVFNDVNMWSRRLKYAFVETTSEQRAELEKLIQEQLPLYYVHVDTTKKSTDNLGSRFWGLTIRCTIDPNFMEKIKWEISEDAGRFGINDLDDLASWTENVLDVPGGNLVELLEKIPNEDAGIWFYHIDKYIDEVTAKIEEELEEN